MRVREARVDDLDAVIHVGVTTWRATYPPITGEAYVEEGIVKWWSPEAVLPGIQNRRVLVAEADDRVVAMAAYTPFEDHLMLWKLYVLPEAQGSGAGRELLTEVIARAGDLPVRLTHLVGNGRAHAVYERLGFVETGMETSPIDGGPEEIVMERPAGWFVSKPTLLGEKVELRPFAEGDVETMARILADPEVLRLTGSVNSTAEIEAETGVPDQRLREWYATRNAQPDRLDLAVVDRASGALVGEIVLNELDASNRSANFRILLGPDGRGRGLGTEATRLIVDHAFRTTALNRIELCVYAFNPRARRTYEKAGFTVEGVQREALRYDGEYVDAIVMSRLRSEHLGG
ncbi:RimJ/RimL family protein N-acetyltransferase [Nocardioides luteus]|uniref:N-acetyltransferase domain-containing protein n=1 Tax=Nocardioides luteus TaxID=1844 RepID=A0ABQ5SSN0_9ACTN|nr:GNAT family N-acetyltransferase [Nocardioides luteus]MDR7311266.1 RimJ/RimL family protein N-acetyltransferase [Nocardioides luteus]GGR70916.1 hypothetical protein GCM10010197_42920 [Nocardioides luteus]GLJ66814.1 hypothetical protein GCM10017579_08500 [Nocardioides luteus]